MNTELEHRIQQLSSPKILDLGCGDPFTFFNLFQLCNFTYTGVDKRAEHVICRKPNGKVANYWIRNKYQIGINGAENSRYLDADEFSKFFRFHFETDILNYLSLTSDKHDVIILSNILHFFPKEIAKQTYKHCLSRLTDDGVIYVSVFPDGYLYGIPDMAEPYNPRDLHELKLEVHVLWANEASIDEMYQFIGRAT